jgi:hypothetical protein
MTGEIPTLVFMMTTVSGWFTIVFNGLDSISIWGITMLDLLCVIAFIDITIWGAYRMIDSNKSDN